MVVRECHYRTNFSGKTRNALSVMHDAPGEQDVVFWRTNAAGIIIRHERKYRRIGKLCIGRGFRNTAGHRCRKCAVQRLQIRALPCVVYEVVGSCTVTCVEDITKQLNQRKPDVELSHRCAERQQVRNLKRLDIDPGRIGEAGLDQRLDHQASQVQIDGNSAAVTTFHREIGRVLGLDVQTCSPRGSAAKIFHQSDHLSKCRNPVEIVILRSAQLRDTLPGSQCANFR